MTKKTIPVLALSAAALSAGALWLGRGPDAAAQEAARPAPEESAREKVERLVPDLMSDSAPVRERAEREILALGEPGRAELDRITRGADPKRAIVALKLLQSDRWDRLAAEEKAAPDDGTVPEHGGRLDLKDLQATVERRMEEMRRRMDAWERQFDPDEWFRDWTPKLDLLPEDGARSSSSGSVVENDRSLSWKIDDAGKVHVTVKDGADAPETTYDAPNLDELRKAHPDVAKRLDAYLPRPGSHRFVFTWPRSLRDRAATAPDLRDGEEKLRPFGDQAATPGPLLGVGCAPVSDVLRDQLDLPSADGLVVDTVTPGSLAERLGMRRNDVLLKVAGRTVGEPSDVRKALEGVATGGNVAVEIVRKGKLQTLTATR